jgi:hypothetical protein
MAGISHMDGWKMDHSGATGNSSNVHGNSAVLQDDRIGAHILGMLIAGAVAWFLVLLFDRGEVVRMEFAGFQPNILVAGEPASVTWKTKVLRTDCDGTVQRKIIDSHGIEFVYQMNRTVFSPEHAIRDQFTGQFIVPIAAAPGIATHITAPVRWCNVVQKYVWPMRNERYEVKVPIIARKS